MNDAIAHFFLEELPFAVFVVLALDAATFPDLEAGAAFDVLDVLPVFGDLAAFVAAPPPDFDALPVEDLDPPVAFDGVATPDDDAFFAVFGFGALGFFVGLLVAVLFIFGFLSAVPTTVAAAATFLPFDLAVFFLPEPAAVLAVVPTVCASAADAAVVFFAGANLNEPEAPFPFGCINAPDTTAALRYFFINGDIFSASTL